MNFNYFLNKFPKISKQWQMIVKDNKLLLSRLLKDESHCYCFIQNIATRPSSDETHMSMVVNTTNVIATEEVSDAFVSCAHNVKFDKIKHRNISKMSNVVENIFRIENNTGCIGSSNVKLSSQ